MATLVSARGMIDGNGGPVISDGAVLIEGGLIRQVGKRSGLDVPPGTRIIDLGDCTILPGLVDMHGHLGKNAMGNEDEQVRQPEADIAIQATQHARICLASGVTTMRTLGEKNFVDVAYRKAIADGTMVGPRVLISTRPLVATGGYAILKGLVAADGPHEIRKAIRENVNAGADLIKMFITGGGSYETKAEPLQYYYTFEEIRVAAEQAHMLGKKVAAHCHGGVGARYAIEAGVDTIDHGHFLSDDELALMAEHGTALVATMAVHLYPNVDRSKYPALEEYRALVESVAGQHIRKAKQHAVRFAFGTDAMHGLMGFEVGCGVRYAGLSPIEAISAATKTAAEICGLGDKIGTLEAGKWADLVAVEADPSKDVDALSKVRFVMKAGRHYDPIALTDSSGSSTDHAE